MTDLVQLTFEELSANAECQKHINLVQTLLRVAATDLLCRGEKHDISKLEPPEVSIFAEYGPKLKGMTYGSEEYRAALTKMKPALDHHYSKNSHHPEHYPDGIDGMNLFDLLEMLLDWLASTQRHADGNITRSIEYNTKRFGISTQLSQILTNTIRYLKDTTP